MPTIKTKSDNYNWIAKKEPHERRKAPRNYKFYNSTAWRRYSKAYRQEHPICEECERNGLITPGKHVDHIVPVNQGGAQFDWENLQTLCLSCHARKSAKEGGRNYT